MVKPLDIDLIEGVKSDFIISIEEIVARSGLTLFLSKVKQAVLLEFRMTCQYRVQRVLVLSGHENSLALCIGDPSCTLPQ